MATNYHILINSQSGALPMAQQLKNTLSTLRAISVQIDEVLDQMNSGLNHYAANPEDGKDYVRTNWGIPLDEAGIGDNVQEVMDMLTDTQSALHHARVTETLRRMQ